MPPYVMEWQIKTTVLSAQSDLIIVVGPEWRERKRNVARPKLLHQQCNMSSLRTPWTTPRIPGAFVAATATIFVSWTSRGFILIL